MSRLIRSPRPAIARRGVTLVEMLIAVALLVLMMTVIVQVLIAATSAVSTQKVYQELDSSLRQLESTIRQDLSNTTARMTPGITSPTENRGYFEYIENSFADLQLEDTDDCLRFTVKAPEGQVFTGRMYLNPVMGAGTIPAYNTGTLPLIPSNMPVTITSQYAEVIYFVRAGNLYRRVLLVAPERQNAVVQTTFNGNNQFFSSAFSGLPVSWQGVNDLSAHPSPEGNSSTNTNIILNTLGHLTNRENRYAAPRFINDFVQAVTLAGIGTFQPDGVYDDQNNDTVPDYYPSVYFNMVGGDPTVVKRVYNSGTFLPVTESWVLAGLNPLTGRPNASTSSMAFPYVYPYAYSRPDPNTVSASKAGGWIHTPNPNEVVGSAGVTWLSMLNALNHNPIASGDSLLSPVTGVGGTVEAFFGFPTWRETMSPNWADPFFGPISLANTGAQSVGLTPLDPSVLTPSAAKADWPPVMTSPTRVNPQLYADTAGSGSNFGPTPTTPTPGAAALWQQLWEDDLVLTGVRSFDVKAYDDTFPGYVDLGWGNDLRLQTQNVPPANAVSLAAAVPQNLGIAGFVQYNKLTPAFPWQGRNWNLYSQTFAHEGRIPPMNNDLRFDPFVLQDTNFTQWIQYIDDSPTTIRLRRTWDSWSTDYSRAPASGIDPSSGQPIGYPYGGLPVYPSFPPPYEAPLRGLQVQIRVVDPRSERVKVLTIRQDFSDKLQ
jgi:type II secretory pathway component PulJ